MNIAHGVIGAAYGDERSTVLAYGHLLAAVGLVLAAIAVAAARSVDQWRLAFVAPIAAIALILLWNLPGRLPTRAREATTDRVTYAAVPAAVWIGGVVLALSVGVEWAVTFWAASFLRDPVGLRPAYADATTVAVLAALVIGRWVLGRLTVRYAANRLLRVALVVVGAAAVPYLLGARLEDPYGAIVAVAGLGTLCLTITMLFPLALVATMGAVGGSAAEQQRASAAALLIGALGAVVTPYLLGAVADATTLTTALLMIPVGSALAMVSLALMHRSTDRQLVRAQR